MQWFRLYQEFATDPKVQMLSEANQRRLVMLFCFRCNSDVTLHDEEITFQLRISPEEWATTKAEFIRRGFMNDDNEVLNWDKRQYISDSSNQRVKKFRESRKRECNVTVTPPDTDTDTDTDTEQKVLEVADAPDETPKPKSERGTRLEAYLEKVGVDQTAKLWGDWAVENVNATPAEVDLQLKAIRDWALSVSGQKGVKNDWFATWRGWMRRWHEKKTQEEKRNAIFQQKRKY